MSVSVIICAAGKGERAGFSQNKVFEHYQGIPVLERTISAFLRDDVSQIIVAHAREDMPFLKYYQKCEEFEDYSESIKVVANGSEEIIYKGKKDRTFSINLNIEKDIEQLLLRLLNVTIFSSHIFLYISDSYAETSRLPVPYSAVVPS